jgi:hypothetical protein
LKYQIATSEDVNDALLLKDWDYKSSDSTRITWGHVTSKNSFRTQHDEVLTMRLDTSNSLYYRCEKVYFLKLKSQFKQKGFVFKNNNQKNGYLESIYSKGGLHLSFCSFEAKHLDHDPNYSISIYKIKSKKIVPKKKINHDKGLMNGPDKTKKKASNNELAIIYNPNLANINTAFTAVITYQIDFNKTIKLIRIESSSFDHKVKSTLERDFRNAYYNSKSNVKLPYEGSITIKSSF